MTTIDIKFSPSFDNNYQMIYFNTNSVLFNQHTAKMQTNIQKHVELFNEVQSLEGEVLTYDTIEKWITDDVHFWIKIMNTQCYKTDNVLLEITFAYVNGNLTVYISKNDYEALLKLS